MKIAIIGGGASGLVTAYLLDAHHEVHLFEKDSVLGGNIRTIGGNVLTQGYNNQVPLENGVLGFHVESYPNFHRLMDHLGMDLYQQDCSAGYYIDGFHLPANEKAAKQRLWRSFCPVQLMKAFGVMRAQRNFWKSANLYESMELETLPFKDLSPTNQTLADFIKGILMISFSTPFEDVSDLPGALAIPFLKYLNSTSLWSFVEGGVYAYVERMMESFAGKIFLQTEVNDVFRGEGKIQVKLNTSDVLEYDKVIIATTPEVVLKMLSDPTEEEKGLFAPWVDRSFKSVLHMDEDLYNGYGGTYRTPMDVFKNGMSFGYNTYLNEVYRIAGSTGYSFQYGLDEMIPDSAVIHSHTHTVPVYTSEAYATRHRISEISGKNNTFYAGAWLGNALHEGAVSSAMEVARRVGGKVI